MNYDRFVNRPNRRNNFRSTVSQTVPNAVEPLSVLFAKATSGQSVLGVRTFFKETSIDGPDLNKLAGGAYSTDEVLEISRAFANASLDASDEGSEIHSEEPQRG